MKQEAVFGGGCFWCAEATLRLVPGVEEVVPGYAGGSSPHPTYDQVCSGATGHAEVVKVVFDDEVLSYDKLLRFFFTIHDPTTVNRQGADVGTQYRSVIVPRSPEQQHVAQSVIATLNDEGLYPNPIVTTIEPDATFFEAETYHHRYFEKNPEAGYCQVVIAPKVAKIRSQILHPQGV
jgi:peptide-methionine (S)-S-oxide reductase